MKAKSWAWLAAVCATAGTLPAAFAPGGAAYTKRIDTALLAEPQMLAPAVAHVTYAKKLKVESLKGAWVRVNDGKAAGWVFGGNLAEEKPSETKGLDGLPFAASETSASTAARPLVPAAEEYSERHNLGNAAADLAWLTEQCAAIKPGDVQAFLQDQKKGEFK